MLKKIICSICIILLICCIFNFSYASDDLIFDIFSGASGFIKESENQNESTYVSDDSIRDVSNTIYNTLLIISTVIAVIIAGIMGIKFMIGSVEEKSEIKESLIPFLIGCVVIFGSFGIWKIFVTIGNRLIS